MRVIFTLATIMVFGFSCKKRTLDSSSQRTPASASSETKQSASPGEYQIGFKNGDADFLAIRDCKGGDKKNCDSTVYTKDSDNISSADSIKSIKITPEGDGDLTFVLCKKVGSDDSEFEKIEVDEKKFSKPNSEGLRAISVNGENLLCQVTATKKSDIVAQYQGPLLPEPYSGLSKGASKNQRELGTILKGAFFGLSIGAGFGAILLAASLKKRRFPPHDEIKAKLTSDSVGKDGILMIDLDDTMWEGDYEPRRMEIKDSDLKRVLSDAEKKRFGFEGNDRKTIGDLAEEGKLLKVESGGKTYIARPPEWFSGGVENIAKALEKGMVVATNSTNFRPGVRDFVEESLVMKLKELKVKKGEAYKKVTIAKNRPSGGEETRSTKSRIKNLYVGTAHALGVGNSGLLKSGLGEVAAGLRTRMSGHKYGIWERLKDDMLEDKIGFNKDAVFMTFDDKIALYHSAYKEIEKDLPGKKHLHVVAAKGEKAELFEEKRYQIVIMDKALDEPEKIETKHLIDSKDYKSAISNGKTELNLENNFLAENVKEEEVSKSKSAAMLLIPALLGAATGVIAGSEAENQ